jgi:Flp pilus assembly protein TadG
MVLVAIAMVAIIAMAALSIDVITLYLAREEAQRSADEAALAAARVISLSGITGDPGNVSGQWVTICGPAGTATLAATAVATQSAVGGTVATTVNVTYSYGTSAQTSNCSTLIPGPFGVNPQVNVQIIRSSLPTFFSRIWGNTGNSVSASATAEVFNPSASDDVPGESGVVPVQPSCVKPWMVPNQNPNQPPNSPSGCVGGGTGSTACSQFVSLTDGAIQNPGIQPGTATGVIGETFTLFADCASGSPCALVGGQPQANAASGTFDGQPAPAKPNLEYLPGLAPATSLAAPSCAASGSGGNPGYEPAVAGCDQNTIYYCGVQSSAAAIPNSIDLSENPGGPTGDTASALACLLNNDPSAVPLIGQDQLNMSGTPPYPYQILAGSANPNAAVVGDYVTSSNSIMSLPIYDNTTVTISPTGTNNVTIVGFLQVFVQQVNGDGSLNVTVMNVAGCGNGVSSSARAVTGSSPVPIRLVTPP